MRTLYERLKDKLARHAPIVQGADIVQTWRVSSAEAVAIVEGKKSIPKPEDVREEGLFESFGESFSHNLCFFEGSEPENHFGLMVTSGDPEMSFFMVHLVRQRPRPRYLAVALCLGFTAFGALATWLALELIVS